MSRRLVRAAVAVTMVLVGIGVGATPASAAPPDRIEICHRHVPTDSYRLMTVSSRSLPAHEEHGDGVPGGPVAGEDATFDDECQPVSDSSLARAGCFETRSAGYFVLTDGTSPQFLPAQTTFYGDPECTAVRLVSRSAHANVWEATESDAIEACIGAGGQGIVHLQGEPNLWACY
ncbi:MAG: hypothetical protein OSA99_11250 [Acidimicrobiales bacterium]|nr:hypothetical protein [Acidimicrobiales bacterium]